MNLASTANKAWASYLSYEKARNGWYTSDQCAQSERMHTKAINAAYKALESGVSASDLDYFH